MCQKRCLIAAPKPSCFNHFSRMERLRRNHMVFTQPCPLSRKRVIPPVVQRQGRGNQQRHHEPEAGDHCRRLDPRLGQTLSRGVVTVSDDKVRLRVRMTLPPPASLQARFSLQTDLQNARIGGTFAAFLSQLDCRESWLNLVRPQMALFSPKAGVEVQLWKCKDQPASVCRNAVRTGSIQP